MSNIKKPLTLGEKIKKARKESGYSQKQFGDALRLSDKAISSYEVGRALPSIETLREMGGLTQRPSAYFLDESDDEDITLQIKIKIIEKELLEIKQILKNRGE